MSSSPASRATLPADPKARATSSGSSSSPTGSRAASTLLEGGIDAIKKVRETQLAAYLRAIVSVLPKQLEIKSYPWGFRANC
jgi:hypothetical protein